mmetsp:Transcript_88507/g.245892  ORF Transcript_88507/g.245892 Transcript_88507/m.245892 type:complete len:261 (-) Transcript_88507:187-969(-)
MGTNKCQTSTCSGDVSEWKRANIRRERIGPRRRVPFLPRMGYSKSARNVSPNALPGPSAPLAEPAESAAARATASSNAAGVGWKPAMALAISSETPGTCISCETHVIRNLSPGSRGSVWQRTPATLKRDGVLLFLLSATDMAHCRTYSAACAASRTSTTPTPCLSRHAASEVATSGFRLAGLEPQLSTSSRDNVKGRGALTNHAMNELMPIAVTAMAAASSKHTTTGNGVPTTSMAPATPASIDPQHCARCEAYWKPHSR